MEGGSGSKGSEVPLTAFCAERVLRSISPPLGCDSIGRMNCVGMGPPAAVNSVRSRKIVSITLTHHCSEYRTGWPSPPKRTDRAQQR